MLRTPESQTISTSQGQSHIAPRKTHAKNKSPLRKSKLLNSLFLTLFLTLTLALTLTTVTAQDFSGVYTGILHQRVAPPFDQYVLRLELEQKDNIVLGRSLIHVRDSVHLYAEMDFEGIVKGNKLYFREQHIKDSYHLETWDWCLKKGILEIEESNTGISVSGPWEGWVEHVKCESGNVRMTKLKVEEDPPEVVEVAETSQAQPKPEPESAIEPEQKPDLGEVEGREITRQRTIQVHTRDITAYVYDANKEDGDVISLQFNGDWILKDYSLLNRKRPIRFQIEPGGDNRLILYAEDMGSLPPNTCALIFFDGERERKLNLMSNEVSCGALKFEVVD